MWLVYAGSPRGLAAASTALLEDPALLQPQKQVHHHRLVMLPAHPTPSFEVVQSQFFLELLVILRDGLNAIGETDLSPRLG